MQKCSINAYLRLSSTARLSFNTVRFSSSIKVPEQQAPDRHSEMKALSRREYRFMFPEFLPDPNPEFRNTISEKLQRKDMIARRDIVEVPGLCFSKF